MNDDHILLIKCPDRKGLIAAITGIVFRNHLNIMVMKEYVEPVSNTFFARLELKGEPGHDDLIGELREALPGNTTILLNPKKKKDLVILVSKEHHCLGDLLIRHCYQEMQANIRAVIGNHNHLRSLSEKFEVPFFHIAHDGVKKNDFEERILEVLDKFEPDFLVLAKFMRILSPAFVSRYQNKIINIHHSFLPAFAGANPYRQAYERGVKLIGATAHIVTDDLDEGPIITQKIISVDHEYDVRGMVAAGHDVERNVLAEALRFMLEDRVFVLRNKTIIFD
jgi:formyltetrahydrofolate deformylase